MVKMITQSEHVYAGRALRAGDAFDCEPQHVHLMTVLGRARTAPQEVPVYETRDMVARTRRGKRLER